MDKKTEIILDRVAEEWAIARKKLGDRCPEIKENDVELIQAIKTVVTEANVWIRFIKKNESSGKSYGGKYSKKDDGKPTPKQVDWLSKHGVDSSTINGMTKHEASVRIDSMIKSEDGGNGDNAWF